MAELVVMVGLLIGIPGVSIAWLVRRRHSSRREFVLHALATFSYVAFVFLWGQYPVVGSYYLRFLFPGAAFVATAWVVRREWGLSAGVPNPRRWTTIVFGATTGLLVVLVARALVGRAPPNDETSISLDLPLRGGTYYVSDGGGNALVNIHHKAATPAQRYAIDLVRLNRWGGKAASLLPSGNHAFPVFGEPVHAPCAGTVRQSRDGIVDNRPHHFAAAPSCGNYVALACDGVIVQMCHLQRGSVRARENRRVARGQRLGRVGNSGLSTEPHLHIQAFRVSTGQDSPARRGVPMRFERRFLARNDLVKRQ